MALNCGIFLSKAIFALLTGKNNPLTGTIYCYSTARIRKAQEILLQAIRRKPRHGAFELRQQQRHVAVVQPNQFVLFPFLAANGLPRYGQPEPPRRTVPVTFAQFPKKSRISVTDALPLSSSYTYRNA